ncbi:hypothetical protein [Hyalangium gracile]|uniref:hypothetical protein n=1 Tax=Hyalangium gracile TaxID=394092 RepID=UPI001CCD9DC4|nr:hypothetical protein [Hyalangium gracile]
MRSHVHIPAPPRIARHWLNKMLGLGVGVALGLAPLLGGVGIPGFKALLLLYPESLRYWVIPLASLLMGGMATAVQFYGEEHLRQRWLRRMFSRLGLGLLVALLAFVFLYQKAVVLIRTGEGPAVFVRGMGARSEQCPCNGTDLGECTPCGSASDAECFKDISLDPDRIASCWSRGAIDTSAQVLALGYLVLMGGLGAMVGILVLRGQQALRHRQRLLARGKHPRAPARGSGKGAHPRKRKPAPPKHSKPAPRHRSAPHPPKRKRQK